MTRYMEVRVRWKRLASVSTLPLPSGRGVFQWPVSFPHPAAPSGVGTGLARPLTRQGAGSGVGTEAPRIGHTGPEHEHEHGPEDRHQEGAESELAVQRRPEGPGKQPP